MKQKTVAVLLETVRTDGGTQIRAEIDQGVVGEYAQAYQAGEEFPALSAVFDGEHYWLWDGFHRLAARKEAGLEDVTLAVTQGTLDDARWLAVAANKIHGIRRTPQDKRRAIFGALKLRPDLTDSAIGKHVSVDPKTVASCRAKLAEGGNPQPDERRVGLDGRSYPAPGASPKDLGHVGNSQRDLNPSVTDEEKVKLLHEHGDTPEEIAEQTKIEIPKVHAIVAGLPPKEEDGEEIRDGLGCVVPEALKEAFQARAAFRELLASLRMAQRAVAGLAQAPGGEEIRRICSSASSGQEGDPVRFHHPHLKAAIYDLEQSEPYAAVCPYCHDSHPGRTDRNCRCCRGAGWVGKAAWGRAPADLREAALLSLREVLS
jgi:hypothetical protein